MLTWAGGVSEKGIQSEILIRIAKRGKLFGEPVGNSSNLFA
jgi:hypothetical protein